MLRGPYKERTSFAVSGVDSWREKSDGDGESSGFGVEFDPPVEVLFHYCDDSNNASPPGAGASYARTAKEGREPLSRVPFFLVPHFCLSPLPSSTYPSVYIYSYLFSYDSFIPCSRALLTRHASFVPTVFPPFYFFFYFFLFLFFEKVRDSYFLFYVFFFFSPLCA